MVFGQSGSYPIEYSKTKYADQHNIETQPNFMPATILKINKPMIFLLFSKLEKFLSIEYFGCVLVIC